MTINDASPGAQPIAVVLFDVGGVLVELDGVHQMLTWLEHRLTIEELWQRWLGSPAVRAFESGRSDAQAFARGVLDEFEIIIDTQHFLQAFTAWPTRLFPGTLQLLAQIPTRYQRALLSNSNTLHWSRIMDDMQLGGAIEHHFASHLTGRIKPDAEAFQYVIDSLGCTAQSVLFLDDNRLNVATALSLGMQARVVRGIDETAAALIDAGVLDRP